MANQFDEILDRRCTECFKWNYFDSDVLPMWVADMDFKAPPAVIQALQDRVAHGVFGYAGEAKELQAVIAERMLTRYGWKVKPEAVVFIPGVITGFNLACQAFARPDGEVLIQTPVYSPFFHAAGYAGMKRVDNSLQQNADSTYRIDVEAFEAAMTKQTALFILCNPHNPVGRVFRRDELERMAEICLKHHVPICSDEIHSDLIFSRNRHIPIASLDAEIERQTITLIAPSKTFNIAGLDCAAAIIPDAELRKRYQEARKGLAGGVNLLGLTAGLAAYRDGQGWLDELMIYLEGNRDFLMNFLQERMPEIRMTPVEGTYLAWLDCRMAGLGNQPAEFFLEHGRIGLNEGGMFGKEGEGFVRLNFGCPRSLLADGLERMAKCLGER